MDAALALLDKIGVGNTIIFLTFIIGVPTATRWLVGQFGAIVSDYKATIKQLTELNEQQRRDHIDAERLQRTDNLLALSKMMSDLTKIVEEGNGRVITAITDWDGRERRTRGKT